MAIASQSPPKPPRLTPIAHESREETPQPAWGAYQPGAHVPALDGIRGVAILAVMAYHFMNLVPAGSARIDAIFCKACDAGWVGVDLFFVLSGFLITGILIDSKGRPNYFRRFYARRFLRIFPLYYAILAAIIVVFPLVVGPLPLGLDRLQRDQAWYWSYLLNWKIAFEGGFDPQIRAGYLWSLAVEEQFYLLWPPLVLLLAARGVLKLSAIAFAISFALRNLLLASGIAPAATYAITFTHMDGMLVGAVIAAAIRTAPMSCMPHYAFSRLAALSAIAMISLGFYLGEFNFYDAPVAVAGSSCLAICFGYALFTCLRGPLRERWSKLFDYGALRSFGRYSYCIYLIHSPVAAIVKRCVFNPCDFAIAGSIVPAAIVFLAISGAACWSLAFASWHLFEKHFLALKPYFDGTTARRTSRVGSCVTQPAELS